jgi:O-antigen/teichoic acid export membrane protein
MTTRGEKLLVLKNAVANLVRGSASAVVALLLPPFLTRSMSADAFGAWSLVLQLSAYVGYLDFGIQTAISRFVAHSTERQDAEHRDRMVSTALACLAASGALALFGLSLLAVFLPRLFPHLPGSLIFDVRMALVLVGGSLSVGLPSSVFAGIFVGLQRNEVPAAIIGGSRLLSAALVVLVVHNGGGIALMAMVVAAVNLGSYLVQYISYRRVAAGLVPRMDMALKHVSKAAALELFDYCFSLTVWGLGLLLVTGLDLTIVGMYRFNEVGYYAVAATVVTFLAGLFGAIFGAMGSTAAVVHARGDRAGLGRLVIVATRLGMILLLVTGLPLILFAHGLLRLWVGPLYASHATILLQVLVAANVVRICATPYVLAMIGSGEQRRVILIPLLEGCVNLVCSVIFARYIGAVGVALGTLIGAIIGLTGNLSYNMPRTLEIKLSIREYVWDSLLRPLLSVFPVVLAAILWQVLPPGLSRNSVAVAATLSSLVLFWRIAVKPTERKRAAEAISAALHIL